MNKEAKSFQKEYGLDLLPYAESNVQLLELMEVKGLLNKQLNYLNVSLLDELQLAPDQLEEFNSELAAIPLDEAQIPTIDISKDFQSNSDLKVPMFKLDLSAQIDFSEVDSFTFSGLKSKRIFGKLKVDLENLLEDFENSHKDTYKSKIKHNYIIESLWYADSLTITTKSTKKLDIKAQLDTKDSTQQQLDPELNKDGTYTYKLDNASSTPFAAQLTQGKNF